MSNYRILFHFISDDEKRPYQPVSQSIDPPTYSESITSPPVQISNTQSSNQASPNVVYVQQPVFVLPARFGEAPQQINCPHCRANVLTRTEKVNGIAPWLIAGGCCLFG